MRQRAHTTGGGSAGSTSLEDRGSVVLEPARGRGAGLGRVRKLRAWSEAMRSLLASREVPRVGRVGTSRSAAAFPDIRRVLAQRAAIASGGGGRLSFGPLPLFVLSLVLLSSFLLVASLLPPGVIAYTPLSPERFARIRQPLALTALSNLLALLVGLLAAVLS